MTCECGMPTGWGAGDYVAAKFAYCKSCGKKLKDRSGEPTKEVDDRERDEEPEEELRGERRTMTMIDEAPESEESPLTKTLERSPELVCGECGGHTGWVLRKMYQARKVYCKSCGYLVKNVDGRCGPTQLVERTMTCPSCNTDSGWTQKSLRVTTLAHCKFCGWRLKSRNGRTGPTMLVLKPSGMSGINDHGGHINTKQTGMVEEEAEPVITCSICRKPSGITESTLNKIPTATCVNCGWRLNSLSGRTGSMMQCEEEPAEDTKKLSRFVELETEPQGFRMLVSREHVALILAEAPEKTLIWLNMYGETVIRTVRGSYADVTAKILGIPRNQVEKGDQGPIGLMGPLGTPGEGAGKMPTYGVMLKALVKSALTRYKVGEITLEKAERQIFEAAEWADRNGRDNHLVSGTEHMHLER